MAALETYLSRSDLRKWDKKVADLMLHLVNDLGIRYRAQDANHLFLYAPNKEARPFKVSASRPGPVQVKYLTEFMHDECPGLEEKWAAEQERRAERGKTMTAAPTPRSATPEADAAREAARPRPPVVGSTPAVALRPIAPGRTRPATSGGRVQMADFDGQHHYCLVAGCGFKSKGTDVRGIGGHYRIFHEGQALGSDETRKASKEARRANFNKKVERQTEAVLALAETLGLTLGDSKVERLTKQLEKVTAERDEAVAKVKALKEALK